MTPRLHDLNLRLLKRVAAIRAMLIRSEQAVDRQAVRHVNRAAFGGDDEANLVDGRGEGGYVEALRSTARSACRSDEGSWLGRIDRVCDDGQHHPGA